jgi:type II secretory pathway predicted ATPase ExeA
MRRHAAGFRDSKGLLDKEKCMYREHWRLTEAPFRACLDTRYYYATPGCEEALARLQFLADEHRRVGLCLGPAGGGKSMLSVVFARRLRRQGRQVINLGLIGADLHEFLWRLAADLGGNPRSDASELSLWRAATERLAEYRLEQLDTIVLLDDADEAEPPVLDAIARLAECQRSSDARLTIIATAATTSVRQLASRLVDQVELRIELEPWEQADTVGFVLSALRQAGRREPVFADEALVRLHELCDGIPRRINHLANLSLLAGAGQRAEQIDAETVESAFHELATLAI